MTIVSIFVNPTQFNKKDDFKKYPRNIQNDIAILKKLNVEYLFTPNVKDIFKIIVDKRSFLYVAGSQINYHDGLMGNGFMVENPKANSTCGCGESFSI